MTPSFEFMVVMPGATIPPIMVQMEQDAVHGGVRGEAYDGGAVYPRRDGRAREDREQRTPLVRVQPRCERRHDLVLALQRARHGGVHVLGLLPAFA